MLSEEVTCEGSFAKHQADAFLFAPESEVWRINHERCGLIHGPAAAVLQVSHPRVAQGVHDHSNFRTDRFYRDMCRFGTYLGVDESLSPKGWHAFEVYYNTMLEGDLLGSHWMQGL